MSSQPTIVHPSTAVPGAECFHSWSIHDPSAAALPVDHNFATTPAPPRMVPRQPSRRLSAATNAREQHILEHNVIQFQPLGLAATTTSSTRPRSTCITDSAFTAHSAITSPDPETSYNPSTGSSMSSPTVRFEEPQGSAATPSPHVTPNHNPASPAGKGSIWSEDEFIAAYQAFFLPHPIKDSSSPAQVLGPIHHDLDTTTVQQANSDPALEDRATKPVSYASQTWLENGELVDWTLRLMPVAPVDPQQSEALKIAVTAGFAHTLRLQRSLISSGLLEETYTGMHPSPPKIQSSYSELAYASVCSPYPSARAPATSSMRGPATTLSPAVFAAQSSMSLNTPSTSWVSSDHHGCANSMTILDNEDERSRFDAGNRTCSEIELLELSLAAFFDARQAYNTSQQLHDTT